jgi:hypothetical protein
LNTLRVWPYGIHGYVKQWKVKLKCFVKGDVFENLMTLAVTANTVSLAMDSYGISSSTKEALT